MSDQFPFNDLLNVNNINNLKDAPIEPEVVKNTLNSLENTNNNNSLSDNNDFDVLTQEIKKYLVGKANPSHLSTYFNNNFKLVSLTDSTATFEVATVFIKKVVEEGYKQLLSNSFLETLGRLYDVEIIVCNNKNYLDPEPNYQEISSGDQADAKRNKAAKDVSFQLDISASPEDLKDQVESQYIEHIQDVDSSSIDTNKTFRTFVVGPSNNMAYASCMAVGKNPGKSYPTVYLHSKSGLGKTHLLHAVANQIREGQPNLKICLTSASKFLQEMVESIRERKMDDFRRKYTDYVDVLMIDDIHELKNKQGTQNAFFHIFNDLYNKGKQLIFTSDKTPKEIDGIEDRIKTRLSWGLVLDIQQPDLETRIAILKRKAQVEDIYLSDDVLTMIATSIKDNIRELEGSLIKLAAYSSIFKQDIDVDIAKRELNLSEVNNITELTLDKVARGVSNHCKVSIADLKSKSRVKDIAHARHIAMYLSYKLLKTNLIEIGRFYGNRDHTSVLHAVNKIKKNTQVDIQLSKLILSIENYLS